jgi:hypothetical protein
MRRGATMLLTRDLILACQDLETCIEDVPEWGGSVTLQALNGTNREIIEARVHKAQKGDVEAWKGTKTLALSMALINEDRTPMFSAKDVAALGQKHSGVIDRLFSQVLTLSKMTKSDQDALAKN